MNTHKIKIGVITSSVSRHAGGLFDAVRGLALEFQRGNKIDVQLFSVIDESTNRDIGKWGAVAVNLFRCIGPRFFGYAPRMTIAINKSKLELLHTHGIWMYQSITTIRWAKSYKKPYLISPHGMLDSWAVQNSQFKKCIANILYENKHLSGAACLHALCLSEYKSIRSYGLCNPVAIIPNGVNLPDTTDPLPLPAWSDHFEKDSKVLLFLGRIHPKKGLENLLQSWAQVLQLAEARQWKLVIAGWDQSSHQSELEYLAEELGVSKTVFFVGAQFDKQKAASLARADAFVLPSFSEGLPMAVLEAWSYNLPVLMTSECNLPEGFEAEAAIKMVPEINSIAGGLSTLFNLPDDGRLAMGQRGRSLVEDQFTWQIVATRMCAVYTWVLGQGSMPPCVVLD